MRYLILPVMLSSWPVLAMAECAGADDLAQGVRFELANGGSWIATVVHGDSSDRSVQFYFSQDAPELQMDFAHGLYMTRRASAVSDFSLTITYDPPVDQAPVPAADAHWETRATYAQDGEGASAIEHYDFGRAQVLDVAGCQYDVVSMVYTLFTGVEDQSISSPYLWFEEFGTLVLIEDPIAGEVEIVAITAEGEQ